MHRLLLRQIKRFCGSAEDLPIEITPLIAAIDEYYVQADIDRTLIERSLEVASQEMLEQNQILHNELQARRTAESQVQHLHNYDDVTGLPNRNLLIDRLNQAIASAQRHMQKVVVLQLGLDHFKVVNDSLGPGIGNMLLKIIGERLGSCVRASDTVARLSGDEFGLVLLDLPDAPTIYHQSLQVLDKAAGPSLIDLLQRILKIVADTVILQDRELNITCSIGVSTFPHSGNSSEALLQAASAAMNSAKRLGRDNYQLYTTDLSTRIEARLLMQSQLRLAIDRHEFVLHYQPQVDLGTGCMVGMEALVRWNHPERGLVPPLEFIGLAEETGLILPIGAWVIRTACEQCLAWQKLGYGKIRMAVNLSVRQFEQPDLIEYIETVLADTGLEPHLLEIELTESLVMHDVNRSIEVLRQLKSLGLQMSVDDFGTGYSSLAYLKRFPIDLLKIDQSFVRDIGTADDAAIVKAILAMAHSLGMRVIAEGVETEAQCDFLRLNMCDEIQGYLFSRPLSSEKIDELLARGARLPDKLLRIEKAKRTLLLVDDEPNITSALNRLLRHNNMRILTANCGQAGLDLLTGHAVDVIVSDQRMPGMTGVEFLKIVKKLYPHTIRIVLSGFTELHSVTEAVNEGAIYKFLTKPWDDKQLQDTIENAFRHKEMENENRRLNFEVRTANRELVAANRKLEELLAQAATKMNT
jgi:diguanylate cyclase (GGDEF)-like protein